MASNDFYTVVGPGQADFETIDEWSAGTACDYRASSGTQVVAGTRHGTINAGASVTGSNSGVTGTVVYANAAGNQILIKDTDGTFEAAENIAVDGSNYFTSSGPGYSAIGVGLCAALAGQSHAQAVVGGAITDSDNYRVLRPSQPAHYATQPWDSDRFNITSSDNHPLWINEDYFRVENLQIEYSGTTSYRNLIYGDGVTGLRVTGCVIRLTSSATNVRGIYTTESHQGHLVQNCFVYGMHWGIHLLCAPNGADIINNTVYGCSRFGITLSDGDGDVVINNLAYNNTDSDFSTPNCTTFTNNFSKDNSAGTGDGNIRGDTDGKYPQFVSTTADAENFHLQFTSDAINAGAGPDSNASCPAIDFEDDDREGAVTDIGADQYYIGYDTEVTGSVTAPAFQISSGTTVSVSKPVSGAGELASFASQGRAIYDHEPSGSANLADFTASGEVSKACSVAGAAEMPAWRFQGLDQTIIVLMPDFTAAGVVAMGQAAGGSADFPDFEPEGVTNQPPTLTGSPDFPDFDPDGTVVSTKGSTAEATMAAFDSDGEAFSTIPASGTADMPFEADGSGTSERETGGTADMADFTASGLIQKPGIQQVYGSGSITLTADNGDVDKEVFLSGSSGGIRVYVS